MGEQFLAVVLPLACLWRWKKLNFLWEVCQANAMSGAIRDFFFFIPFCTCVHTVQDEQGWCIFVRRVLLWGARTCLTCEIAVIDWVWLLAPSVQLLFGLDHGDDMVYLTGQYCGCASDNCTHWGVCAQSVSSNCLVLGSSPGSFFFWWAGDLEHLALIQELHMMEELRW